MFRVANWDSTCVNQMARSAGQNGGNLRCTATIVGGGRYRSYAFAWPCARGAGEEGLEALQGLAAIVVAGGSCSYPVLTSGSPIVSRLGVQRWTNNDRKWSLNHWTTSLICTLQLWNTWSPKNYGCTSLCECIIVHTICKMSQLIHTGVAHATSFLFPPWPAHWIVGFCSVFPVHGVGTNKTL